MPQPLIRAHVTRDDETIKQGPKSKRQRAVSDVPVSSLLPSVCEILVSYVATHKLDDRPVCDQKTCKVVSTLGEGWKTN